MAWTPERGRETQPSVAFDAPRPIDARVAALAAAQHCVFGLDQLCALGIGSAAVRKRAAAGRLHRIHQTVYSLVPRELLTREGHWMAAVLAAGPGAVLSHRSAAALHGLRPAGPPRIEVSIPGRTHRVREGLQIHRPVVLDAVDLTTERGIPCTTVARTMFDISPQITRRSLERAFDQAEILEVFDLGAIQDLLERHPNRKVTGIVRALLNEHYIGSTPTESEIEDAFLLQCREDGLPEPEVAQWIVLGDGGPPIRADFLFRQERVVVETDGERYHNTAQARQRDPERDQRLTAHLWRPVRATGRQILYRGHTLTARLRAILAASWPPGR